MTVISIFMISIIQKLTLSYLYTISMKGFKNGKNVLTRLVSLDYTGFSKGFRIIERLYPMHEGQNDLNPLIYKDLLLVLPNCKKWRRGVYFVISIF